MTDEQWKNPLATGLGFVAILLWSTTVPVARSVMEKFGPMFGMALVFSFSGMLLLLFTSVRERGLGWVARLSKKHLFFCGPLFIGYLCFFYLALGIAKTRTETVIAGLVNYLWPTMILLFSSPLLRKRPHPSALVLGIVISLGGIVLAMSVQAESLGALVGALGESGLPMLLALVGSLMWGLYSNLAKLYPQPISSGAIGIFLFVTGIALFVASFGAWQRATWGFRAAGELTYMIIFPAALAYCLWDIAMRDGNIALLGSSSNLIPVLATLIASAYLRVALRWELLGGSLGVVLGAFLCQIAFRYKHTLLSRRVS